MNYELRIALRYLWMARRRAHTAFLSLISTMGLAVGVATLLISLALLSGLQGQIKQRLIANSPRLLIEPAGGAAIQDWQTVLQAVRSRGLQSTHAVVSGIAWGSTSTGRGLPVRLRSYDAETKPPADQSFGRDWSIEDTATSIYLRRTFAASVGAGLGEELVIVAPRMRLTPFGPVPVWRKYTVTRILPDSNEEHASDAYLSFEEAGRLFATGGRPTAIEVFSGPEEMEDHQAALQQQFPSLQMKTWKEINRPLFLALRLEKIVMFATISLIILVAALNLVSSISMLIVEKRPQVGILRTLGASQRGVLTVFLAVGLLIGTIGTIAGNVIGIGVSWAADRYELVPLPGDVYFVSHIPFKLELSEIAFVNLIAVLLTVVATWYPARVASQLDPIAAIRDE